MTQIRDKADEQIINMLKEDSRVSFVDIGKSIGISESAIRRRVKNLLDSNTISKFTIEMNERDQTSAIVFVSTDSSTDTSKISTKLSKINEVKVVYEITGQYDIATIISASNMSNINAAIDTLRKIKGVTDTNTIIILKKVT